MTPPSVCYLLSDYRSHRRAGLDYRLALEHSGINLVDDPADADVVILHDEPWAYPAFFRAWPILKQRHVVAYAVWEPDLLPDDHLRWLCMVDEIWTSSSYCAGIFRVTGKPVLVVPHIVTQPDGDPDAALALRARLGVRDEHFVFYTIGKIDERKNIEAGIRAYSAAFPQGGPAYVVRTTRPLSGDQTSAPGVIAWNGDASDAEIAALHDIGDCLISPHCAEGWGLCISDAMVHGNLVVATGFSGNMDYMGTENSLPVDFTLTDLRNPEAWGRFSRAGACPRWAYVNEDDLAQKLRFAHERWGALADLRNRARLSMTAFGADEIGSIMSKRLKTLVREDSGSGRHA